MKLLQMLALGAVAAVGIAVLLVVLSALFAVPTYYLWNGLMPKLFGITKITFLQAWGINILSSFLFKSSTINTK